MGAAFGAGFAGSDSLSTLHGREPIIGLRRERGGMRRGARLASPSS